MVRKMQWVASQDISFLSAPQAPDIHHQVQIDNTEGQIVVVNVILLMYVACANMLNPSNGCTYAEELNTEEANFVKLPTYRICCTRRGGQIERVVLSAVATVVASVPAATGAGSAARRDVVVLTTKQEMSDSGPAPPRLKELAPHVGCAHAVVAVAHVDVATALYVGVAVPEEVCTTC